MGKTPKYKVGLRNRTIAERFSICGRIVDAITGVPVGKRKGVNVDALQEQRAVAEAADADVNRLQVQLRTAFTKRNNELASYCEAVTRAGGVAGCSAKTVQEVLACGFEIEAPKRPIGLPGAPTHFRAVRCGLEGAVKLRCRRPVRRCFFIIEMTTDPSAQTGWVTDRNHMSAATRVIRGLQPGVLYWFRICAHNTAGQGPWSDYVSVRPAG